MKFGRSEKLEQAAIVKTVADRMRAARADIAHISQSEAARMLGYANSSKLAKIEGATDTNSVPLWVIVKAARVYDVSMEWLVGLSDDWDTEIRKRREREIAKFVNEESAKRHIQELSALYYLLDKIEDIEDVVAEHLPKIDELGVAISKYRALNPKFDDSKASAGVVGSMNRIADTTGTIRLKFARFCDTLNATTYGESSRRRKRIRRMHENELQMRLVLE